MGVTAATSVGLTELRAEVLSLAALPDNPHTTGLWYKGSQLQMVLSMTEKDPQSRLEHLALIRHSAVSWIEQSFSPVRPTYKNCWSVNPAERKKS